MRQTHAIMREKAEDFAKKAQKIRAVMLRMD